MIGFKDSKQRTTFSAGHNIELVEGGPSIPTSGAYVLELQQRDYLGNVRLRISDRNADGAWEYTGRFDCYPFGMSRKLVDVTPSSADALGNRERFGGKEREVGLNMDDFGARWYEPGIGRWGSVDPLAGEFSGYSPYNYGFNYPVRFTDPTGMAPEGIDTTIVKEEANGTYTVVNGIDDGSTNIITENGDLIGQSLTPYSFMNDAGGFVEGASIDLASTEGQDFIDNQIVNDDIGLLDYMANATTGEPLDYKDLGSAERDASTSQEQHRYRGSTLTNGEVASARDVGNVAAGIVAARNGVPWPAARMAFDALEARQQLNWGMLRTGPALEGKTSVRAQSVGHNIGPRLNGN